MLEELQLAEVRLVLCHVPPHRERPRHDADCRLELLQLAVQGVPGLLVDDRELRRDGPSYTVDTLASLRGEFSQTPLCLIIGMDSFLNLPSWHRWRELTDLAHIVVLSRPGYAFDGSGELAEWLQGRRITQPQQLAVELAGSVYFHPVTQLDISATRIRSLIGSGRIPRFLMPDAVWQRIAALGLYGWPGGDIHPQPAKGGHD